MWVGLLTDRINNKMEKRNLINEHALNREPVPLREQKKLCKEKLVLHVFVLKHLEFWFVLHFLPKYSW